MEDEMNTYNSLINNLETLELNRIKENIDQFLDMIADGSKTALDAIYELTEMELGFRKEQAITGCVKVANFPYLKEINEFDFSFQPSIDKSKIMDLMTLRFIEKGENIIFCGTPGGKNQPRRIDRNRSSKTQVLRIFYNFPGINIPA